MSNQPIPNWAAEITNANYNLNQSQLSNNSEFTLITTANPDGTFDHLFVGTNPIPPFGGIPGGAIGINGFDFGFNLTSDGITAGTVSTGGGGAVPGLWDICLLYTSPSPRDRG